MFYYIIYIYIYLFWFIFSSTHTGKGQEYQFCLYGRIYYTFVPFKESEGICT